jgi:anti-sigma regulatory factor (Ser/Thr protein kinase)
VIPIILRPVNWKTDPFAGLQALPENARPVTKWGNRDEAFMDIAEGIRRVASELRAHTLSTLSAGRALVDPERWYESLSAGSITLDLDPKSESKLYTFFSVVDRVLQEKGFRQRTIDRVGIILDELLTNVARHVPESGAWVMVVVQAKYLRLASIAVCDSGPGIPHTNILENHMRRLAEGEREHGLLRVLRMASSLRPGPPPEAPLDKQHGVYCDVFDPQTPHSVLFESDVVAPVRMEYGIPRVLWIGREEAYTVGRLPGLEDLARGGTIVSTLTKAVENGWRPILDLYFEPLLSAGASYLGVEVTGGRSYTEPIPGDLAKLCAVLETYFKSFFEEKRVILLAHHTDPQVRRDVSDWAQRWGTSFFDSEPACRKQLTQLAREI